MGAKEISGAVTSRSARFYVVMSLTPGLPGSRSASPGDLAPGDLAHHAYRGPASSVVRGGRGGPCGRRAHERRVCFYWTVSNGGLGWAPARPRLPRQGCPRRQPRERRAATGHQRGARVARQAVWARVPAGAGGHRARPPDDRPGRGGRAGAGNVEIFRRGGVRVPMIGSLRPTPTRRAPYPQR